MFNWLKSAFTYVKKLPVARLLKPFWKSGAKELLEYEGNNLQLRVRSMIDDDKDASITRINRVFDGWQVGVIKGLRSLAFLPAGMVNGMAEKIQSVGDVVQERVVDAIKAGGPKAVDAAFDGLQARLAEVIDAA